LFYSFFCIYRLVEQNQSLKEQLLLSQNYGAKMLKELNEAKEQIKIIKKRLNQYENNKKYSNSNEIY